MTVRRLGPEDAPAVHTLRREALESNPYAFGSSPEEDRFRTLAAVVEALGPTDDRAVFGAFADGRLVGMVGILRQPRLKSRHVAFVWGMFVAPAARGRGTGRGLLDAVVAHARAWRGVVKVELGVTEAASSARRLYTTAGFRAWGRESRALCWQGRYVDQTFMTLDLDGAEV